MRYASVCSGVEAASLAWMPLGWKPVFFSEVEPFPCAVLQQRFDATKPLHPLDPAEAHDEKDRKMRESWLKQINKLPDTGTIPNLGDFTKIKGEDYVGTIDVLVGGTPCQDLSVAGKRAGFEGARSSLALDFVRLAYESRCKYFVWENVPGVFSSNGGRDFATLLSYFAGYEISEPRWGWKSSGIVKNRIPTRYGLAWRVLDAQFTRTPRFPFAVPQRRRRVFLVGCLGDWERAASILLEPDRLSWDTPPRIKTREEIAGDSGDRAAQTIRMRAGCEGGGKGALIGNKLSNTLQTGNDQTLIEFAEDSANCLEASCYKGPAGTWNERTIVSQFWNGEQVAESLTTTSNNQRMPDKGRLQAVVANGTSFVGGFIGRQGSAAGSIGYEENVAPTQRANVTTDVVCFQQNTRDEVRQMNGDGAIAGALAAENGMKQQNYLCYDNQTYARNPKDTGPICGTLEAHMGTGGNTVPLVQSINCQGGSGIDIQDEHTDTVTAASNSSGNNMMAVAIAENVIGRKVENGGNGVGAQDELAYTQNATGVMGVCVPLDLRNAMRDPNKKDELNRQGCGVGNDGDPMGTLSTAFVPGVAVASDDKAVCTKGNGDAFLSDVHTSLSVGGGQPGQGYPAAMQNKTVRRLLPVEAERLMGHPDNHTRIAWQGKPAEECPDAPRYKAEGNSMCTNCMEWIGRRIEEFDR